MNKTTEALKLAENTLRDIIRVYEFEGGTPVTALAAIREALDHSGDANEMVMDWSKVKPEAIKSDPMYQMGYAAAKAEPVKQEPVAWDLAEKVRRDLDRQSCPGVYMNIAVESIVKHYPAPVSAKREWVDLTDDEIYPLYNEPISDREAIEFARAVITAFKEKNK